MAKKILHTAHPGLVSQHLVPSDFEICCPKDPAANDQSKLATCCVPQEPRGIMGRILKSWWTIMNKYEHVLVKSSQIFHFREEWFLQSKFQWTSTGWPDHLIRLPHLWTGILDASPLERPFFSPRHVTRLGVSCPGEDTPLTCCVPSTQENFSCVDTLPFRPGNAPWIFQARVFLQYIR